MTEGHPNLDAACLSEYFRELVREALDHQKLRSKLPDAEAVEYYLVNLLTVSLHTSAVYGTPSEGFQEEPLAFLYIKAVHADNETRIQLLRKLGDFSLFICGFFPSSLTRRLMDISYYVRMGESAYSSLSRTLRRPSTLCEIFGELASRFIAYADILSEVSEKSCSKRDSDLLRLYETWLKTGSQRAARLLSQQGILPVKTTPDKAPH